jgi:hypothetical protein
MRVIAFVAGSQYPTILRSGKTTGVSVASGGTTNASVTLADVSGAVDPSTPTSVVAGQGGIIKINLTDPGDFLDGATGILYTSPSPPLGNHNGVVNYGSLVNLVGGAYQFSSNPFSTLGGPTSGTIYYNFGGYSSPFNNPGVEIPGLFWPNLV